MIGFVQSGGVRVVGRSMSEFKVGAALFENAFRQLSTLAIVQTRSFPLQPC